MEASFSLFLDQPSRLHRLHPLTKLSLVGFLLLCSLALPGTWTPYVVFGLALLPLAALGGVTTRLVSLAARAALPFAISVFLVQGFFWPGGEPVLTLGPFSLKREGLLFAAASLGRILAIVESFLLLALTTRPDVLMIALTQRGLPGSLAYVIVATVQIVPRFQAKAASILNAQQARGLETTGRITTRIKALMPLVAPLILGSLVDVEERAMAIESRAFNHPGPKTSLIEVKEAHWEPAARLVVVVIMICVVAISVWLRLG